MCVRWLTATAGSRRRALSGWLPGTWSVQQQPTNGASHESPQNRNDVLYVLSSKFVRLCRPWTAIGTCMQNTAPEKNRKSGESPWTNRQHSDPSGSRLPHANCYNCDPLICATRTDESPRRRREAAVVATAPPLLCPASHTLLPAFSCRQIRPRRLSFGPSGMSPGAFQTYDTYVSIFMGMEGHVEVGVRVCTLSVGRLGPNLLRTDYCRSEVDRLCYCIK